MPTTTVAALRHVRSDAPYNANSFAEQNKALLGKSARLSGFGFVAISAGVSIEVEPGFFVSVGLALNPTEPDRIAGIIAQVAANTVLDISGLNDDFYIFGLVNTPAEGNTVDLVTANSPTAPSSQHAPIARYIAGQFILEDALSDEGLEAQVGQARVDSGADQFFLTVDPNSAPVTEATLTSANLPDGTLVGPTAITGLTIPGTTYVWFDFGLSAVQWNSVGFPADVMSLWEFTLDAAGLVTSMVDRRPWFGGAGGGAGSASAIEERLKEILQHSVYQNARVSALPADAAPDIDTGASSGTFLGPSEYELSDTEQLVSDFSSAALEAPASIDQVTVAVLADQLLSPGDITIEVSRDGGANYETVADNFTNHVFGAVPAGNNLQLRVTNVAGGPDPIVIRGYGMYYNNIGGPTGVLQAGPGILLDTSGLQFTNMKPNPTWRFADAPMSFTWTTAGGGVLSWTGDFRLAFWNGSSTIYTNRVVGPASIGPTISDGDYVYVDLNPAVDDAVATLQISVGGPPPQVDNRIIFGGRFASQFHFQSGQILEDSNLIAGAAAATLAPFGLDLNRWQALQAAVGPTSANRFITAAEIPAPAAGLKLMAAAATAGAGTFLSVDVVSSGSSNILIVASAGDQTFGSNNENGTACLHYLPGSNLLYGGSSRGEVFAATGVAISFAPGTTIVGGLAAGGVLRIARIGNLLQFNTNLPFSSAVMAGF